MPKQTHYTDFLRDRQFILWQLSPNEVLETRWQDFMAENPHLHKDIQQAIDYLKSTGLNKNTLSDADREHLLRKIHLSIEQTTKKRNIRRFISLAVASTAAAILIVLGLNLFTSREKQAGVIPQRELIVGNLLNSQDIQLITGEDSLYFQQDVAVEFAQNGKLKITESNENEKTVEFIENSLNTLIVPYGKRSTLTLSDGSKVWLNSGSVLEFPAQFTGNAREIHLASGEMYIEVSPDKQKPFRVRTSDFQVKVHGTKFNVAMYGDSPQSIVLVAGSVSLQSQNQPEVFLSPNEQAVYADNGTFHTKQVDVDRFISWKDGYLEFDNTPMAEVLKQIERYYNLSFNYDKNVSLGGLTCTGKIILSENLDNVMTTLALISSTNYHRQNNQIYIRE